MNRIRLKRASGWFAAGREWQRALGVLSDGGFKGDWGGARNDPSSVRVCCFLEPKIKPDFSF